MTSAREPSSCPTHSKCISNKILLIFGDGGYYLAFFSLLNHEYCVPGKFSVNNTLCLAAAPPTLRRAAT